MTGLAQAAKTVQACEACAGAAFDRGVYGSLARCRGCGHVFYPETLETTAEQVYTEDYFLHDEYCDYASQGPTLRKNFQRYLARMARYGVRGGRLFEVGCAYGFFLKEASARFHAAGIDVTPEAIDHARARLGVEATRGDFASFQTSPDWDVVCLWDTVEHLFEPAAYVRKAHAILRPGGALFMTTGDIGSWLARAQGRKWRMIHPPTHLHYFTTGSMRKLLERSGFEVLGVDKIGASREINNMLVGLSLFSKSPWVRSGAKTLHRATSRLWGHAHLYLNLYDIMFVAARKKPGS
jgi:SAM-dependent methyltransferase